MNGSRVRRPSRTDDLGNADPSQTIIVR